MASPSAGEIGRQLGRLFSAGSAVGLTDGELIERFTDRRGESVEAAFETILARHGGLVWTVCRQVLGDAHAAEDAFQATFLVLVRRAASLRVREQGSLGPWLFGVAYRIALKARQGAARRRMRERRVAKAAVETASDAIEHDELHALLHDEVNRLPAKYRAPLVLCYFEGRTHEEAAAALQWPVGTVRSNLSRARDQLRSRLARRGLAPAPAGLVGASSIETIARAEVPATLHTATVAVAIRGTPAATVAALTKRVLRDLFLARLRAAVAAISAMVLLAAVAGFAAQGARPGQQFGPGPARVAANPPRHSPVDPAGDPLPRYARLRLGDLRFHHDDWVRKAVFTSDGHSLVTLDKRGQVRVWDVATGRTARKIGDPGLAFGDMAISPDGRSVATVGSLTGLRLWDLPSGHERRRWHKAKEESYADPRLSPDGRTIAVAVTRHHGIGPGNSESFVNLLDVDAPSEHRRRMRGDWNRLRDLAFSPDGHVLAATTIDGPPDVTLDIFPRKDRKASIRLWDVATIRELGRFPVEGGFVGGVAFSPDGRRLMATDSDGAIRCYDRTTGQEILPRLMRDDALHPELQRPHPDWDGLATRDLADFTCMAISADGKTIAAGSHGSGSTGDAWVAGVYLWDVASGRELHRIPAHMGWNLSVSFSPDGRTLVTTGTETVVRLWDVATGREALPQSGHRSSINIVAVSPADGTILTTGQDGTIREWDPATGRERGVFAQFSASISGMVIDADGKTLLTGERFGAVKLWDVAGRREIRRFASNEPGHGIWNVAFSPDGRQVIATGPKGDWAWDLATGQEVRGAIRIGNAPGRDVISPDGRYRASGGLGSRPGRPANDPSIRIREQASAQEVATLRGHEEGTAALAFSPDGRLLAAASRAMHTSLEATVQIWDLAAGRELRRLEGHRSAVKAVAFTPDGRSIVSGSEDATALVWDVSDLKNYSKTDEPLTPESLPARWDELAGNDARAAYRAAWALSVPSAVGFLRDHLKIATMAETTTSPEVLRRLESHHGA